MKENVPCEKLSPIFKFPFLNIWNETIDKTGIRLTLMKILRRSLSVKMVLTSDQRVFVVEVYFNTSPPNSVREAFGAKFPTINPPSNESIRKLVS